MVFAWIHLHSNARIDDVLYEQRSHYEMYSWSVACLAIVVILAAIGVIAQAPAAASLNDAAVAFSKQVSFCLVVACMCFFIVGTLLGFVAEVIL